MLHSYFKIKNKHYKTLDYINSNSNSKDENLFIKKKIKKLNQYQYFFFLNNILENNNLKNISINTLELFFEKSEIILNASEYISLQKNGNTNDFVPVKEDWITFHHKDNLKSLIDYFLNTKEYPKETLITKLLVLSERTLTDILQSIFILRVLIDEYVDEILNGDVDEKYYFLILISNGLENEIGHVQWLLDSIQEKIDSLSKTNIQNENYLIDIDNEILKKLYWGLEKNMLIDQEKTSLKQFIEVLKHDWKTHNSIMHLEMDNIQFRYFIECIDQFLKTKIPLTFIQRSGNIRNKNGKIKAGSMYTAGSNNIIKQKDIELIRSIFEKI
ncbi:hypothetical protein EOD40_17515 [Flavobacterium sufflavum]|uniref:Uncharacterized protein n=1 Tax=Flavobacterium sufflavum TaxID=1921138 RepID=A0A3S2V0A6_9FLAO|nr:hypothetical protein [Flavobacterium sufflavum]RVT71209.1 hypothetical protein EOD40_17515 [Flavobacterium sufflavum]